MDELDKRIQETQQRLNEAVTASSFADSPEGKMILDYINDRVSSLLTKMVGSEPLNDRTYLSYHGGVRELQQINTMLQAKAAQVDQAKEELDALRQDTDTRSAEG